MLNDLTPRMVLTTTDGSGTRVTMSIVTETIPHKSKDNGKHGDGASAAASSATYDGDAEGTKGGGCILCKIIIDKLSKYLENTSH